MLKKTIAVCTLLAILLFGAVLVQAPPSLGVWLVDAHEDFFQMPYPEWAKRHSFVDRMLVRAVAYKLSRDWVTRAKTEISDTGPLDASGTVVASRDYFSREFVNQRQIRHPPIDLPTYSRLVYGMAWCDGQNHLFSMILGEFFDDVYTFALINREKEIGRSPHTAVAMTINQATVFADAWSDVPIFTMDDQVDRVGSGIPGWSAVYDNITLQQMDGTPKKRPAMAKQFYDDGEKRIRSRKMIVSVGSIGTWDDGDAMPDKSATPFQTYLKGRIYQLYGHVSSAMNHFEAVRNDPGLEKIFQRAAAWFMQSMAREI